MNPATLKYENGQARLEGDLTFPTVSALYDRMQVISNRDGLPGVIDLAEVRRIDSAGLTLLLEWQSQSRRQDARGALIEILNPPAALLKIARLCDAEEFLTNGSPSPEQHEINH